MLDAGLGEPMNVKLSEIAKRTGLSLRYWQGRAARGALPGAKVGSMHLTKDAC